VPAVAAGYRIRRTALNAEASVLEGWAPGANATAARHVGPCARLRCRDRRAEVYEGSWMSGASADVRKEMRGYIEDNFLYMHPDLDLSDDDLLLSLGVVDSFGFVELVEEIQGRYGITIQDVEITEENLGSIDAITAFVTRKQGAG
jgi:acyl carrier protein